MGSSIVDFMLLVGKLKTTKRTGWVNNNVFQPESIADHMYRMGILAMLVKDDSICRERCIKMALVHDLAESVVGDITPHDGVSKEKKFQMEKDAMVKIENDLSESIHRAYAREFHDLWEEYEQNTTPESKFVKDLDKFEMILQAYEYEQAENRHGELESFFASTKGKFQHPAVMKWVEELMIR
eukprot:Nk52_evm20s1869 gene=Nk52_evmTU20s1869